MVINSLSKKLCYRKKTNYKIIPILTHKLDKLLTGIAGMALRILGILAGLADGCPRGFLPEILQYKLMHVWEEGRLYQLLYLGTANTVSRTEAKGEGQRMGTQE